jgi:large subunit ribosomal protein L31
VPWGRRTSAWDRSLAGIETGTLHASTRRSRRRPGKRAPLRSVAMKAEIHPDYVLAHVRCSCGNEFYTRSTTPELHVEICSECHPFYTGKQKLVDTGGRVERFKRRAARSRS